MDNFILKAASLFCEYQPNCFHFIGEPSYENLVWETEDFAKPSMEDFNFKVEEITLEYSKLEYQRLRGPEYPPITDYIDGVVKGDQEQIDTYIAACLAVKAKYPKP